MSQQEQRKELNENIKKILNKVKHFDMKLGQFEKRMEIAEGTITGIDHLHERIKTIEKKESPVITDGAFMPNKKFLDWYSGSFAPSEDDTDETEEDQQEIEEIEQEETEEIIEEVSPEVLQEIDEVVNNNG